MGRHQIMLLLALALSTPASAADMARCGTDQFGNVVCLDKDGVLIAVPRADVQQGIAASGVSAIEGAEAKGKLRCAIDSFGNKVCR